ncbi:CoA-binding protein [Candidatus Hecatella orcuttiae]|jgi:hypothetical protein|uniref:CoA-binding protein n=1 Tax=Candidatus Hecatella orcuttiae TaxID=1935119 RepID=UPI002867E315|nr:CoA-binding protein [Candidatus Hecatella orcuttiae]
MGCGEPTPRSLSSLEAKHSSTSALEKLVKDFLRQKIFAVVGASREAEKYGHKIYKNLKAKGYKVYPVNPKTREISGDPCYPSLAELPEKPDVVDIVVPPPVAFTVVKDCKALGLERIWLQPSSESQDVLRYCAQEGLKCIHGVCIMEESDKLA